MTNTLKRSILALALVASANTFAHAGDPRRLPPQNPVVTPPRGGPNHAPEVDPNLALGGFTLVAGMLTVLRSRRSR